MQATAAVCFAGPLPIKISRSSTLKRSLVYTPRRCNTPVCPKASAAAASESSTVDYNSQASVFPAEACDVVGGEACMGVRCPEAKLPASASEGNTNVAMEEVEREYFEYSQPKTVFPGEACDELGGEFCEADYQMGVHRESVSAE